PETGGPGARVVAHFAGRGTDWLLREHATERAAATHAHRLPGRANAGAAPFAERVLDDTILARVVGDHGQAAAELQRGAQRGPPRRLARGSSARSLNASASRPSGHVLSTSAAVTPRPAAIRMSSGAPGRKVNPRASVSSWCEETPRSRRMRSGWKVSIVPSTLAVPNAPVE